jgi:hypothetical protein
MFGSDMATPMERVPPPSSEGLTASERYLARLCRHSFLRLWSWPNLFRDQRAGPKTGGKEVCDLLAVFDRHVFLFSDKYCAFPDTGDLHVDWSRWFKRAVWDGAKQVWGAERWINEHPDRLFCDAACTARLPIHLPPPGEAIFHRIVVAHGAGQRCYEQFGSPSLMIAPSIIGKEHFEPASDTKPFTIGMLDPTRGFVHVMDDFTLDVVLRTVDTVSDLAGYLQAKEELITSDRLIFAPGEEELLAYYLKNADETGRHIFAMPKEATHISLGEGFWDDFQRRPERLAQLKANEVSYAWDVLINKFVKLALTGNPLFPTDYTVAQTEAVLRLMASECRTERRGLARALLDTVELGRKGDRFARVLAERSGSLGPRHNYVFMTLKRPSYATLEEYVLVRQELLKAYCMVLRLHHPSAKQIVGIATSPNGEPYSGEDLVCLDGTKFDDEMATEAERLKQEFEILTNFTRHEYNDREYPVVPPPQVKLKHRAKGRNRNLLCPCGSGKKVKKCEGSEYHAAKM